jgi:hypothetical protein
MCEKRTSLIEIKIFGTFLLIFLLVGCAGRLGTYKGSWVAEDDRIVLQDGGSHKGSWQTRDVTIEYTYQKESQNLQISGVVKLARYLTTGFNTLEYFRFEIYALDADGVVLDSKLIRNIGYRRILDFFGEISFDTQLELAANSVAMAFGYSGRVTEGGGRIGVSTRGDQIDWNFWKVPGRRPSE